MSASSERLTLVSFAVGAYFVRLQLQKTLNRLLVLGSPFGSRIRWPPRHDPMKCRSKQRRRLMKCKRRELEMATVGEMKCRERGCLGVGLGVCICLILERRLIKYCG